MYTGKDLTSALRGEAPSVTMLVFYIAGVLSLNLMELGSSGLGIIVCELGYKR
jgi:hypothetical protein